MIYVVNKRHNVTLKGPTVYVGRGSELGNPVIMKDKSDEERNRVCNAYEEWLRTQLSLKNPQVRSALNNIYKLALNGDVYLECYCSPKRCHADFIKKVIENALERHNR